MNVKVLRTAGLFGVLAPVFGFFMVLASIGVSPWFSWVRNALSDLGVSGLGSILFNSGLIVTGVLMIAFFFGLKEIAKGHRAGQLGSVLFLASALFVMGVGVFNETFGRIHFYVSVGFFVSLILSLLIIGIFFVVSEKRGPGILGIAAGLVGVTVWLISWEGVAIPEAVSSLAAGVWTTATGIWMIRVRGKNRD